MNSEDLIQDRLITRLITEIRKEDPSPEEVRSAVDHLKGRLGSRLAPAHLQLQPSPRSRGSAGAWLRLRGRGAVRRIAWNAQNWWSG